MPTSPYNESNRGASDTSIQPVVKRKTPLDIAKNNADRGWTSVSIPLGSKKPAFPNWQNRDFETDDLEKLYGEEPGNVGVLMGPKSGGLTDVDLDVREAVNAAPKFLSDTGAIFGRKSNLNSHWEYITNLAETHNKAAITFKDPDDGQMLLETRIGGGNKGAQTLFPGSTHPSGELIEWSSAGDPEPVSGEELLASCKELASASVLARHWGPQGGRNDHRMALHGWLARNGYSIERAAHFVGAVTVAAGGEEEPDQRLAEARTTQEKLLAGGNVPGFPSLADAVGIKVAAQVSEWLGFAPISISSLAPANDNQPFGGLTAHKLQHMDFPDIKYIVPGYITEGATILAGRPKIGKSWMAMALAIAVASGGLALGNIQCEAGDVLYLALEDNPRRLQRRLRKMAPSFGPWPEKLSLSTSARRLNEGGVDDIAAWLDDHPEARMVIIDTLAKVRGGRKENDSVYEADYKALEEIQGLAIEQGVAIVLVHHVRKMDADDPLDTVSGSTGLTGVADTILVLNRDATGTVTLYGRGRDIEEIESVVEFDTNTCTWRVIGDARLARLSDERKSIIRALEDAGASLSPSEIAEATDITNQNVRQLLGSMAKSGEVKKAGRGQYVLCDDVMADP